MKNYIKKWLGITKLEGTVGEIKPKKENIVNISGLMWFGNYEYADMSLAGRYSSLSTKHDKLQDDFEELDKKFDALERYLQIEYYKEDKETQVYDWADKKHSEGFRKTKQTYEEMKADKDKKDDCDD